MALFRRENIAVPDERKDQIVYKWPDLQIRRFTKAIVAPDEVAVFLYQGQVIGTLPPGRHQVDATELPFLGMFKDILTGGNAYRTELYFVSSREIRDRFGGRVDEVQDPQTGMLVTLRVFGDYILKVTDPVALITKYSGTQNVPDNGRITDLCDDLLLRSLRQDLTRNIVRNGWPVLGLSAFTDEIEGTTLEGGNARLADYGLSLVGLTNFVVSLDDETEAELRRLAKDTAYSRLAGGFQQYAAGEMALGAGEGMAKGGGGVSGAFLGAGIGLGGVAAQPPAPGPPPPPAPGFAGGGAGYATQQPATVDCPSCHAANAAGAKFCASCGSSLAPPTVSCPSCQAPGPQGSKFCPSCGSSLVPAVRTCAGCGAELAEGAKFCATCGKPTAEPDAPPPAAP
ncbi:MAG TPA: SPFH domain-containing protein [Candidatus Dormibacteraeota bacterium]|jgi:membrane protease subunit (stomatin/prohibitin family)|nr:SPFH domain-containing protein [Candidatus Dormibacteraeota bacterium]